MDWILSHLQHPPIDVLGRMFSDLDYADDVALTSTDTVTLKDSLLNLDRIAAHTGLKINWLKTKIQNLSTGPDAAPLAINSSNTVDPVTEFVYLGSKISSDGRSFPDILYRIALAASAMEACNPVWSQKKLSLQTKLRIYGSCVLAVLLYGSETWTILSNQLDKLESFHMRCQRRLLNVKWFDRITNASIYTITKLPCIYDIITKRRLSLFGHVLRLPVDSPPYKAVSCAIDFKTARRAPPSWRRPRGRPRSTWINQIGDGSISSILHHRDVALGCVHGRASQRAQPP
jgi:hypothetical protein